MTGLQLDKTSHFPPSKHDSACYPALVLPMNCSTRLHTLESFCNNPTYDCAASSDLEYLNVALISSLETQQIFPETSTIDYYDSRRCFSSSISSGNMNAVLCSHPEDPKLGCMNPYRSHNMADLREPSSSSSSSLSHLLSQSTSCSIPQNQINISRTKPTEEWSSEAFDVSFSLCPLVHPSQPHGWMPLALRILYPWVYVWHRSPRKPLFLSTFNKVFKRPTLTGIFHINNKSHGFQQPPMTRHLCNSGYGKYTSCL